MNDNVESIYTQMFAPNPIPKSVRELFDKTNFYASRVDAQQMTPPFLALIAAVATATPVKIATEKPETRPVVDTSESKGGDKNSYYRNRITEPDGTATVMGSPAPQTSAETQTPAERPDAAPQPMSGPTGPMDAPSANPIIDKGELAKSLSPMTKKELIAHAMDVCGLTLNQLVGRKIGRASNYEINSTSKSKIIAKILGQE